MCSAVLIILCLLPSVITLGVVLWVARQYFRARGMVFVIQRKMDELLDELLDTSGVTSDVVVKPGSDSSDVPSGAEQKHRDRLAALAAGGQAKQYA